MRASVALRAAREAAAVREHPAAFVSLRQAELGWRAALEAAVPLLETGGVGLLEVLSHEHHQGAGLQQAVGPWHAGVSELTDALEERGCALRTITPIGLIAAFDATAWHARTRAGGPSWDRLLSWWSMDARFAAFLTFMEQDVASALPAVATGRFIATFARGADRGAGRSVAQRDAAFARAIAQSFARATALPFVGEARWESWSNRLRDLLEHPPNLLAAFRLAEAARVHGYAIDLADLAGPAAAEIEALQYGARVDAACRDYVECLQRDPVAGPLLRARPQIEAAMEWDLIPRLIAKTIGLPTE